MAISQSAFDAPLRRTESFIFWAAAPLFLCLWLSFLAVDPTKESAAFPGGVLMAHAQCYNGTPTSTTSGTTCTTCSSGWDGPHCNISCSCTLGVCGGVSGDGSCVECWQPFYGPTCSSRCSCMFGICDNRTNSAGHCTSCLNAWLTGVNCDECVAGRGGTICQVPCPVCVHGTCDEGRGHTGACVCEEGWYGSLCNRDFYTRTKSISLLPPPTDVPPVSTAIPTTTIPPSTNITNETAAPNTTTAAPLRLVHEITIRFADAPSQSAVKAELSRLFGISSSNIRLEPVDGSSQTFLIVFEGEDSQDAYQGLLFGLRHGSADLAQLGISQYTVVFVDELTLPPPTAEPTPAPPPLVFLDPDDTIPPYGVALIAIGILLLMVGAFAVVWFRYVHNKKDKQKKIDEEHRLAAEARKGRYAVTFKGEEAGDGAAGMQLGDAQPGLNISQDGNLPRTLVPEDDEGAAYRVRRRPKKELPKARHTATRIQQPQHPTTAANVDIPPVVADAGPDEIQLDDQMWSDEDVEPIEEDYGIPEDGRAEEQGSPAAPLDRKETLPLTQSATLSSRSDPEATASSETIPVGEDRTGDGQPTRKIKLRRRQPSSPKVAEAPPAAAPPAEPEEAPRSRAFQYQEQPNSDDSDPLE